MCCLRTQILNLRKKFLAEWFSRYSWITSVMYLILSFVLILFKSAKIEFIQRFQPRGNIQFSLSTVLAKLCLIQNSKQMIEMEKNWETN